MVAGRYRLLERLGSGSSGVVWRGEDAVLGRAVAVKQIRLPPVADDAGVVRVRVLREARSAARLSHPAVTRVYDVREEGDVVYLVMELVAAPSLRDLVARDGPLDVAAASALGRDVLSALVAAHAAGIVHRDVKPANVLVPPAGPARLTDFGIASLAGDATVTATGLILGSPSYMAPEQATSARIGPPADLWGFGATLYYAVEGEPPFDRGEPLPTLTAVLHDPPRQPVRAGALEPLIAGLLDKDPARRVDAATARRLLDGLAATGTTAAAVGSTAPHATSGPRPAPAPGPQPASGARPAPAPGPPKARRGGGRGLVWPAAALLAVLAALAGPQLGGLLRGGGTSEEPPPGPTVAEDGGEEEGGGTPDAVTVPEGWQVLEIAETGASVAYPPGWEISGRDGTITDLADPEGGRMLRTDWTDSPRADPVAAWEELSAQLAGAREAYEELRIEAVDVGGMPAALWEYRYRRDGVDRRAYNLGIAGPEHGWALNLVTDAARWDESQPLWEDIVRSFAPGSG